MKQLYSFHPNLILRTPAQALSLGFTEDTILAALDDERFVEALFLASPGLYEECRKWQSGALKEPKKVAKLRGTLTRYYTRMMSRCTPFGLFAGCSVLRWGAESQIRLEPAANYRHTRLDMHYLCALAQQLARHEAIRPLLRYWPQTSLYTIGSEVRYVEYYYAEGRRVHQISSVEASPYLTKMLGVARQGLTQRELVALLLEEEFDNEEATEYVQALIEAQVLVSELEPTVTGSEFLHHMQAVLTRLNADAPDAEISAVLHLLGQVAQQLRILDQQPVNAPASYLRIAAALQNLGVPIEPDKLFQTDLVCGASNTAASLDQRLQATLLEAVEALTHLAPPSRNARLDYFRQRFQERYEEREVPLLEALDTESGLAYSDYGKNSYAPLVDDLYLTETAASRSWHQSEAQRFLYQKLREADRKRQYAINITPEEVRTFAPVTQPLPPSLGIMFRIIDDQQIVLDSVGGSSAVNLLGRFAHADPRIERIVQDITEQEQQHNPAVVFAEICHLPASRVGNILLRPSFRRFEIPYLAQSMLPADCQIAMQDMLLSVRQGQLVLRSRKTNQLVVPRLSTAHNFTHQALPVYQFLCDLQTQGLQAHVGFSWEAVSPDAKFFPRLTYQKVVLQPASWHLAAPDFADLLTAPATHFEAHFQAFRAQWQLPRLFTLSDGDHELLVDAENPLLVQVWLDTIRQRPAIRLREYLIELAESPVRDNLGRPHAQQLLALLVRNAPCYAAAPAAPAAGAASVQREFALGSEWLYYKWYCGQQMANRILREVLHPLTEELLDKGLVDKWFFIRYADPDNHLRVRFHLPQVGRIGEVVQIINDYLGAYLSKGYIWKSQTDTYRRELERYGKNTIELSESLFHYQSTALLAQLDSFAELDDMAYWRWGISAMEELLDAFAYTLPQKLALLEHLRDSFAREFSMDKQLKTQLDAKYRAFRLPITQALQTAAPPPECLREIATAIRRQLTANHGEIAENQLLGSYLHMLLNRLIPAQARLHELVLYDFLCRYYQSQKARQGAQAAVA
ncbi:lantibiotic dehydratase [Hymenobacter cavernae]|uniref:Lantibiotic dehydratase n=1 Tax=Hymenobacter cavernae TaxID=2044852 RepID=A0ABQ1TXD2_9BACT|nr:lantibiotic dehydratase [Hymenobacter cavernae]GGF03928.1 lantibiotic dehydratase [Hymenobacter cavernae]